VCKYGKSEEEGARERERERDTLKRFIKILMFSKNSHTEPSQQNLSGHVTCLPTAEAHYMLVRKDVVFYFSLTNISDFFWEKQ
jgi:hypothetical protein